MDLTELLGIAGVPTFLFIHPDGKSRRNTVMRKIYYFSVG